MKVLETGSEWENIFASKTTSNTSKPLQKQLDVCCPPYQQEANKKIKCCDCSPPADGK